MILCICDFFAFGGYLMYEMIEEILIESLKLVPFLFFTFLLLEYIEHKLNNKSKKSLEKAGKFGPIIGSVLGAFPQCGFSVAATNLFSARVITLGTLISVYLSTSDEMLPIFLSKNVEISFIVKTLLLKVLIGMSWGIIIDLYLSKIRKKEDVNKHIHEICEEDNCCCKEGLFKSSLKHTFNIFIFIFASSFLIHLLIHCIGEDNISKIFLKDSIFGPFISSLIGLIPNCGSSVIITELYLNNAISYSSMMAGLLTGSGIAILILFKQNKDLKENLKVLGIVYFLGVISGIIIHLVSMVF